MANVDARTGLSVGDNGNPAPQIKLSILNITGVGRQPLRVPRGAAIARMVGHPVEQAFAILRERRRRVRARAELAALDDRMLEDIGITRAEAEFLSENRSGGNEERTVIAL
jgi:uncharacterized protein YjiS (DUF1127 family)